MYDPYKYRVKFHPRETHLCLAIYMGEITPFTTILGAHLLWLTPVSCFIILDLFKVFFLLNFYRGKSQLKHHFGNMFFSTTFSKSK